MPLASIERNASTSVSASGCGAARRLARARAPMCGESEKLTTSAPPPLSTIAARGYEMRVHGCLPHALAAARLTARTMRAWVPQRQRLLASACLICASLGFLLVGEERRRFHDHAVDAVAALGGLFLDEGALHRMRLLRRAEAFERDDLLLGGELSTAASRRSAPPCRRHAPCRRRTARARSRIAGPCSARLSRNA